MITRVLIRRDSYSDSVSLMALSQRLQGLPGVTNAMVAMGTDMNKQLLAGVGLLTPECEAATASDLIIAVGAADEAAAAAAMAEAEGGLSRRVAAEAGAVAAKAPRTLAAALKAAPDANLAFISVPGAFAAREARRALEQGLHVMLYSDNVPLEAEVALKRLAHEKGLLLMGPDCGTAILHGVGLGFANAVRQGPIGIVAASGTGAQEISCLIDRLGSGVSQLIGTGGRDLSETVGGIMTLDGLNLLEKDPETRVIVLVSKPPAPAVAARVEAAARACAKPVVICFLGGETSLDEAAMRAVSLANGEIIPAGQLAASLPPLRVDHDRSAVVGLFSGGTLCEQAEAILAGMNAHCIDLGDDQYTVGRPHPMIDPTLRRLKLLEAADDPSTAVILLDIVLGHGAHADPAGALADAIRTAVERGVVVVASVTGTERDPQRLSAQVDTLCRAGAAVAPTARQAALAVAAGMRGVSR